MRQELPHAEAAGEADDEGPVAEHLHVPPDGEVVPTDSRAVPADIDAASVHHSSNARHDSAPCFACSVMPREQGRARRVLPAACRCADALRES